jgi:adenylate cyclase
MTSTAAPRPAPRREGPLGRLLSVGERPGDDADLRTRKRAAVATALALVIASLSYTPVGIGLGDPVITIVSVLQAGGQLLTLAFLWRTGRLGPAVIGLIALGQLVILSGVASLGGLAGGSGNLVWGLLTPMAAVLFFGRRAAIPALLGYAGVVALGVLLDGPLVRSGSELASGFSVPLYVVNLLGPAAVGVGMVVLIDGERVQARGRAEALLLNVLPRSIVERLHGGERVIADQCPDVTVLFTDVVDFTPFAEAQPAERVVALLDDLFSAFDELVEERGLEKIKTIGDAYMAVAGVPVQRDDHAQVMIELGLAMHAVAARQPVGGRQLQLRTGIATGPVVAGVIGRRKFSYDLWGDTVNTASRMESTGVPGCVQVTTETWERCRAAYPWQVRERVEVKGKGPMQTYLLDPSLVA